jgi:DNA-binding transcriptional ArsR family regulator
MRRPEGTPDDVRSLRALAHPLRLRLLDLLRFDGPATASALAVRMGESSGATSYHLRQLARYGFVEEDARPRHGRERWWRHRARPLMVADPGTPANAAVLVEMLTREVRAAERFLAAEPGFASRWREVAFLRSRALRLAPGELDRLREEIEALLDRLPDGSSDSAAPDAAPVRFLAFGYPEIMED